MRYKALMVKESATLRQLELLGEHIRRVRIAHHFSQVGLAARAGFVGAYYSAIERGKINFSVGNVIKIARALGVEVGALFPAMSQLIQDEDEDLPSQQHIAESAAESYVESKGEQVLPVTLLSAGAAAGMLGVNRRTIERWVRNSTLIPAARVEDQSGKRYSVFHPEDIKRLLEERRRR